MHVAEYCITDLRSRIAVARALGRKYILLDQSHDFDAALKIRSHDRPRKVAHCGVRDLKSGIYILCGDSCCRSASLALIKELECTSPSTP